MRRSIAAAAVALLLASCGSGDAPTLAEPPETTTTVTTPETPTTLPAITEGAAREVAPVPEPIVEPAPVLDAEQILAATVVIASGGDLETAITSGLIGEAEAEAALAALESGSIGELFASN